MVGAGGGGGGGGVMSPPGSDFLQEVNSTIAKKKVFDSKVSFLFITDNLIICDQVDIL
ncbi:MAG: hypothetical protein WDO71_15190 [Bacteroidota bacterium]